MGPAHGWYFPNSFYGAAKAECQSTRSNDMYSGLAEVFGVYQSLQVLHRCITQYPLIYHQNARAAVYCNNQGVIECITGSPTDQQPRNMLWDDYPAIFQAIQQLRTNLKLIQLTFHHIDRHLDMRKPKCPLMIAKTLNIECDQRATQHSQTYPPLATSTNPLMEHSYPHFTLRTKLSTDNYSTTYGMCPPMPNISNT